MAKTAKDSKKLGEIGKNGYVGKALRGLATGVSITLDVKTMSNPNESSFKKEMAAISMGGTVIGSTCNPAIGVGTAIVTIGGSMLYDTVPDGGKKILDKIAEGKPSVYSTNLNKVEASKSRKRGATSNANRNRKSTKKTVAVANRKKPQK